MYLELQNLISMIIKATNNKFETDIYVIDLSSGLISRVTNTEHNESDPIWANTKDLISSFVMIF